MPRFHYLLTKYFELEGGGNAKQLFDFKMYMDIGLAQAATKEIPYHYQIIITK